MHFSVSPYRSYSDLAMLYAKLSLCNGGPYRYGRDMGDRADNYWQTQLEVNDFAVLARCSGRFQFSFKIGRQSFRVARLN